MSGARRVRTMSCTEVMYQAYYPYLYQRSSGTAAPPTRAPHHHFAPFTHQYDRVSQTIVIYLSILRYRHRRVCPGNTLFDNFYRCIQHCRYLVVIIANILSNFPMPGSRQFWAQGQALYIYYSLFTFFTKYFAYTNQNIWILHNFLIV